jgi:hypothetical protein
VVALCERPSKYARPEDYGEHTDHNWSGTTWTGHEYCAATNDSSVDGSDTSHKAITNECCSLRLRPRFGGVLFSCTIDAAAAYGSLTSEQLPQTDVSRGQGWKVRGAGKGWRHVGRQSRRRTRVRAGCAMGLFQVRAVLRTLTIAQRMIQDNGRWRVFLYGTNARARDCAVTTRAPAFETSFAISSAIRGSSSQMRMVQPAKLALLMVASRGGGKRKCQERPL